MADDDLFEWDEAKNRLNHSRHGLWFEDVLGAFDDPFGIDVFDSRHREDRWKLIAKILQTPLIVVVVYTERQDRYRIIRARIATALEEAAYHAQRG